MAPPAALAPWLCPVCVSVGLCVFLFCLLDILVHTCVHACNEHYRVQHCAHLERRRTLDLRARVHFLFLQASMRSPITPIIIMLQHQQIIKASPQSASQAESPEL